MPRHVEYHPYAVKPIQSRPGAGAKEAASAGRPFSQLLAEAEAVQDAVRIRAPMPAAGQKNVRTVGGLVAAATGLWHGLGGLSTAGQPRKTREVAEDAVSGAGTGEG